MTDRSADIRQYRRYSPSANASSGASTALVAVCIAFSLVAAFAAGFALAYANAAKDEAEWATKHAEMLKLEVTGFKAALIAHGIRDTNPHLPAEPP